MELDHDCFLNEEDRQLLRDVLSVANKVKGSVIKGFALGLLLFGIAGAAGIVLGIKEIKRLFWE